VFSKLLFGLLYAHFFLMDGKVALLLCWDLFYYVKKCTAMFVTQLFKKHG